MAQKPPHKWRKVGFRKVTVHVASGRVVKDTIGCINCNQDTTPEERANNKGLCNECAFEGFGEGPVE